MKKFNELYHYFFQSTKGLILLAMTAISVITAVWGTLSGPMVEWGVRDVVVGILGMDLASVERSGRIIMLYHVIAMIVVAIEVYIMTSIIPMRKHQQSTINATITVGWITAMIFGLAFGYFGHNYFYHGLFLVGQSLIFFAGLLLTVALYPWRKDYLVTNNEYAHTKKGYDLERIAFFVMAASMLISAGFGAVTGSFWSNGHETFLAEDLIREPGKTALQKSIIGHLHIMLTLIAVAITLIVGRWMDWKGKLHKVGMPLMIIGTIVISGGVWSVVWTHMAHTFIYVGSVFVMLSALLLVIYAWAKLIRERIAEQGIENPTFFQKLAALLHDPIKFGPFWQMVFMNFTVSGVGIFMAVKLEQIFRVWPAREERVTLTGHWHILSAIVATIIIMYYVDIAGIKGKARKWFGWTLIIASDIAFAAVTIFSMKRLFVIEYYEQPLVNLTMLLTDFGLGAVLVITGALLVWRLIDLFKKDDPLWQKEANDPELDINPTAELTQAGRDRIKAQIESEGI
ncbi:MAG: hypothetical protein HOD43_01985 [Candidatus Marinimicrobia bacterium]|jgi:hypothetical protein|nr:hypothetical protein [Candidatus Neomarinimicrobiota bacterium]MBT3824676.1 hypothetical protein [Candidatus Neomarinimicrobiota bacterium]MBT4130403.1 hypothetical protein [Candidatus Neomarinimicrobiota bacterium]MBT4294558.1 hypothetical protein [Candidatus Neomarinimicrobiota bacterium]MBT4419370.1 hypothetical protein [Candidatus Neomarinimicrobiota bacterium]